MCIVCQTAPLLAAGGGGAGMIWHRARVALGRRGAYDDQAAWAAWAAGHPPWEDAPGGGGPPVLDSGSPVGLSHE
jgi:hypothetical protein